MLHYLACISACHLSFFIGSCCWFITFAKEIKREWIATKGLAELNQAKFKKRVHEHVDFHSSVKQLRKSENLEIFNPFIDSLEEHELKKISFPDLCLILRIFMNLSSRHFSCGVIYRHVALF